MLLLGCALTAQAEVYKCRQPDGSTQISSEPCSGGASTVKTIQDDTVPEAAREQAERDVQRQRQMANQMKSERQADEVAARKEQEALRKASGAPSQAAVQQCLNTLGRMSLDSSRRSELESGCYATGTLQPVQTVQVSSQVSGQIKEVLADFNSEVKRGQLIARIDPETFEQVNKMFADCFVHSRLRSNCADETTYPVTGLVDVLVRHRETDTYKAVDLFAKGFARHHGDPFLLEQLQGELLAAEAGGADIGKQKHAGLRCMAADRVEIPQSLNQQVSSPLEGRAHGLRGKRRLGNGVSRHVSDERLIAEQHRFAERQEPGTKLFRAGAPA